MPPGSRMFQGWLSCRDSPFRRRHTWSARPVRYAGRFRPLLLHISYIHRDIADRPRLSTDARMPLDVICCLAHIPGCVDGCVSFPVPPHDSGSNKSNAANIFRVIFIVFQILRLYFLFLIHCKYTTAQAETG